MASVAQCGTLCRSGCHIVPQYWDLQTDTRDECIWASPFLSSRIKQGTDCTS